MARAAPPSETVKFLTNPTYQIDAGLPQHVLVSEKFLCWTRVTFHIKFHLSYFGNAIPPIPFFDTFDFALIPHIHSRYDDDARVISRTDERRSDWLFCPVFRSCIQAGAQPGVQGFRCPSHIRGWLSCNLPAVRSSRDMFLLRPFP